MSNISTGPFSTSGGDLFDAAREAIVDKGTEFVAELFGVDTTKGELFDSADEAETTEAATAELFDFASPFEFSDARGDGADDGAEDGEDGKATGRLS